MSQPKYSPQQALDRVKLMMKYDTSKTLTENKNIITEQTAGNPITPRTLGYGAVGTAAGATIAGGGAAAMTAGATIGSVFPVVGTAIGLVAGAGLGMLIDWWASKDYGSEGFKQVMSACSSKGVDKLVPQLSKADIRNIAFAIEDAKGNWNDDEDAIKSALERIPTVGDLCQVDKKIPGGLYQFLDDLTDSPNEWKMFTRPLAGMIEDTDFKLSDEDQKKVEEDCKKNPNQEKCKAVTPRKEKQGSKFAPCSGTYKLYCKSPKIGEVQACLGGLKVDNAFGPLTAAKLKEKGFGESFTDADVAKICQKKPVEDKPEISGEVSQTKWSDF